MNTEHEKLTRISREAELLSDYAWLATAAKDPQAKQDGINHLISQWEYLKRAMAEALPEVQK